MNSIIFTDANANDMEYKVKMLITILRFEIFFVQSSNYKIYVGSLINSYSNY